MRSFYNSTLGRIIIVVILLFTANVAFTQSVRINEFMALNQSVLVDEDQNYSDWIEIYNSSSVEINLQGWALSDDKEQPQKWIFPDITINANGYMVIFASGKDHAEAGNELHTNFKISGAGEYLALYNQSGNAVSEFDIFPAQQTDYSFGWFEDSYVEFADPTPGESNSLSTESITPAPIFNVNHGFFDSPIHLKISSTVSSAKIYYTIDGSVPSKNHGTLYQSDIFISTTTVIRAVAIVEGQQPSVINTRSYIFLNDVIHQNNSPEGYPEFWGPYAQRSGNAIADYEMDPELTADPNFAKALKDALDDIPTVSLVSDKDNFFSHDKDPDTGGIYIYTGSPAGDPIGRGWERPVSFEFFDPNSDASLQVNCGIRLQGGHGRLPEKLAKHSFLLAFKSEYGPSKLDHAFFGEEGSGKYDKLILRGGFGLSWGHHSSEERNKAQYQRDIWTKDTQRAMGNPASNSIYVHLYINGIYWGIYAPSERMDADFGSKYMGGNPEDWDVIKDLTEIADGDDAAWKKLFSMANSGLKDQADYMQIQGKNPDGTRNLKIESLVDVANLADYMMINFYGSNSDWDHHNWAAMRNRVNPDKGYKFLCWDGEHMIKYLNGNVLDENNDMCPSRIFQQLMKNDEYKQLFADRVQKHCFNGGALTPQSTAARWMERSKQVETSIRVESARWGDYRRDVHPYQTSGPFALYTYEEHWLNEHNFMLGSYFPKRTDVFISQLRNKGFFPKIDAPVLLLNHRPVSERIISSGDQLSMTAKEGTIYYSTNGTDPINWPSSTDGNKVEFVAENANKRVLIPKADIGNNWYTDIKFDDSDWQICSGNPGGVGYEKNSGYESLISLNVANKMYNDATTPNTSCYLRIPFQVSSDDIASISSLLLKMTYDDGFVAYLNGKKVANANVPSNVNWNSTAGANHEANTTESFDLTDFIGLLVKGDNVLAIQGVNLNTTSSDFIINASLIGSDVLLEKGISEDAVQYTSPVFIEQSAHVKARAFYNGEWSALSEYFFTIQADYEDLKITEIHYNPLGLDSIDGDKFEFIELKNTGTSTLYMGDLQFSNGIDYVFPSDAQLGPQEFIVIASNDYEFYLRYNFAAFGEYKGKLDNNGEKVVLQSLANDTIISLKYNDNVEWPDSPDGLGNSLVPIVVNPDNDQSNPANWRASISIGGSPGADDIEVIVENPDTTEVDVVDLIHSDNFVLSQNYPNPFINATYIDYQIPQDAFVNLSVYNLMGQQITTLVNEHQGGGLHQVEWNNIGQSGQQLSNGIYIYRLTIQSKNSNAMLSKKMILMR